MSTFLTGWFMQLYTSSFHWSTVLRIWDMFFLEGVIALFRVAFALLLRFKKELLRLTGTQLFEYLIKISKDTEISYKKEDHPLFIRHCYSKMKWDPDEVEKVRQAKRLARLINQAMSTNIVSPITTSQERE